MSCSYNPPTYMTLQWDASLHHTLINRNWLDHRFARRPDGSYVAHEPVWGVGRGPTEGGHLRRALRLHDVVSTIKSLGIGPSHSILDVGGAEGYLAYLVRRHTGARAVVMDLSVEACARASELFGVESVSGNASMLPFADDAFDMVVMTEVVEHLVDPIGAILEMQRVARSFFVMSTEEWADDDLRRRVALAAREFEGHMERNVFVEGDLPTLFGTTRVHRFPQRFPDDEAESTDRDQLPSLLRSMAENNSRITPGGSIVVGLKDATTPAADIRPRRIDDELLSSIISGVIDPYQDRNTQPHGNWAGIEQLQLVCPKCKVHLRFDVACSACDWRGGIRCGIVDTFAYRSGPENIRDAGSRARIGSARQDALLALDALFFLDSPQETEWSTYAVASGDQWTRFGLVVHDDGWMTTSTDDPQLVSPFVGVPMDLVAGIEIELEFARYDQEFVEVYFLTDRQFEFNYALRAAIETGRDSGANLSIPLPDVVRRQGDHLVRIRIDPAIRPGATFRVRRCAIVPMPIPPM